MKLGAKMHQSLSTHRETQPTHSLAIIEGEPMTCSHSALYNETLLDSQVEKTVPLLKPLITDRMTAALLRITVLTISRHKKKARGSARR